MSSFVYYAFLSSIKKVFRAEFIFLTFFIWFISFFTFGILVAGFYNIQISIMFFILSVVISSNNVYGKGNKNNYYIKLSEFNLNKRQKAFVLWSDTTVSMIWVFMVACLAPLIMQLFYYPGGFFTSMLWNDGNGVIMCLDVFSWGPWILSVFIQYWYYAMFGAVVFKFCRGSKKTYSMIMVVFTLWMVIFSTPLNIPFRIPTEGGGYTIDYGGSTQESQWVHNFDSMFIHTLKVTNPQTHIYNVQGPIILSSIYNTASKEGNWIMGNGEILGLHDVFKINDDWHWNFSMLYPIVCTAGLIVANIFLRWIDK